MPLFVSVMQLASCSKDVFEIYFSADEVPDAG
jgi:hypothetical protein